MNNLSTTQLKSKLTVRDMVIDAMFVAMVMVATYFIQIPGPSSGGLFHMGNAVHFTIAIVFGRRRGAISGGLGMALFDLLGPWAMYTPFTFVIRFAMGYVIGGVAHMNGKEGKNFWYNLGGILVATVIMLVGYWLTEVIFVGDIYTALVDTIGGNTMQCIVGAVVSLPLSAVIIKAFKKRNIMM